jgi:pentose-5-phosphate-3-epimerase
VHVELGETESLLHEIADLGLTRGLALEPETPYDAVVPFLAEIDLLLVPFAKKLSARPNPKGTTTSTSSGSSKARATGGRRA